MITYRCFFSDITNSSKQLLLSQKIKTVLKKKKRKKNQTIDLTLFVICIYQSTVKDFVTGVLYGNSVIVKD